MNGVSKVVKLRGGAQNRATERLTEEATAAAADTAETAFSLDWEETVSVAQATAEEA